MRKLLKPKMRMLPQLKMLMLPQLKMLKLPLKVRNLSLPLLLTMVLTITMVLTLPLLTTATAKHQRNHLGSDLEKECERDAPLVEKDVSEDVPCVDSRDLSDAQAMISEHNVNNKYLRSIKFA